MKAVANALFVAWLAACFVVGCNDLDPQEKSVTDQCARIELFNACIDRLPAGPESVHYNDWSEVVDECDSIALYQSKRKAKYVSDECRVGSGN